MLTGASTKAGTSGCLPCCGCRKAVCVIPASTQEKQLTLASSCVTKHPTVLGGGFGKAGWDRAGSTAALGGQELPRMSLVLCEAGKQQEHLMLWEWGQHWCSQQR